MGGNRERGRVPRRVRGSRGRRSRPAVGLPQVTVFAPPDPETISATAEGDLIRLGYQLVTDTKRAGEAARLKTDYGVAFPACSNTMKAMHLSWEDLVEQVDRTVPAMVRLMELQEQGWVYIKPCRGGETTLSLSLRPTLHEIRADG